MDIFERGTEADHVEAGHLLKEEAAFEACVKGFDAWFAAEEVFKALLGYAEDFGFGIRGPADVGVFDAHGGSDH